MAVCDDGRIVGAVSGGCVEGAIVDVAGNVLAGAPPGISTFGYSDDEAFAVGLTCGGTLHVFVEQVVDIEPFAAVALAARSGSAVALGTVVRGSGLGSHLWCGPTTAASGAGREILDDRPVASMRGSLGDTELDRIVGRDLAAELLGGRSRLRHYGPCGEAQRDDVTVFVDVVAPPPELWIFGAVDFTGALVRVAKVLGYRVTVCDARAPFATEARFPQADEIVVDWPHRLIEQRGHDLGPADAVCVLTHDHKFDVPAIRAALGTDVGYLGAMGSRRTTAERRDRLLAAGVDGVALERLHAPIGLDIGSRTPEEAAVSICAEIIASRTGRTAASLRSTDGPLHAATMELLS